MLDFLGDLKRTHMCGALRASDAGSTVILMGWVNRRRDLGNLIFLDVRDRSGITQVVSPPSRAGHARQGRDRCAPSTSSPSSARQAARRRHHQQEHPHRRSRSRRRRAAHPQRLQAAALLALRHRTSPTKRCA